MIVFRRLEPVTHQYSMVRLVGVNVFVYAPATTFCSAATLPNRLMFCGRPVPVPANFPVVFVSGSWVPDVRSDVEPYTPNVSC